MPFGIWIIVGSPANISELACPKLNSLSFIFKLSIMFSSLFIIHSITRLETEVLFLSISSLSASITVTLRGSTTSASNAPLPWFLLDQLSTLLFLPTASLVSSLGSQHFPHLRIVGSHPVRSLTFLQTHSALSILTLHPPFVSA